MRKIAITIGGLAFAAGCVMINSTVNVDVKTDQDVRINKTRSDRKHQNEKRKFNTPDTATAEQPQ